MHSQAEAKLPQLSAKSITLKVDSVATDAVVLGDAFLLEQVMSNLLDNAIDFCPEKGAIQWGIKKVGDQVELWLENDGEPVPDYALEKVFDRFFSLARPETGERSSGLGLSFVKQVVALHKGEVSLINKPASVMVVLKIPHH